MRSPTIECMRLHLVRYEPAKPMSGAPCAVMFAMSFHSTRVVRRLLPYAPPSNVGEQPGAERGTVETRSSQMLSCSF